MRKIVLLKDVASLGSKGQILDVKDGYARHLISSGSATVATQNEMQKAQNRKDSEKYNDKINKEKSEKIFDTINNKTVDIFVNGGDNGKLHESVTPAKISSSICEKFSVDIPKNKIKIKNDENRIHSFGLHDVSVYLFKDVVANLNVNVIQENI